MYAVINAHYKVLSYGSTDYHKFVSQAWVFQLLQATKDVGICTVPLQQEKFKFIYEELEMILTI